MRRLVTVVVIGAMVLVAASTAFAHGPWWGGGGPGSGMGPGMGHGMMGHRMGGGPMAGAGPGTCPMSGAQSQQGGLSKVTEDEAKALAEEYVKDYLPGFTIEQVSPIQGRRMVAYQVELKGPKGEKRILHVNPWGNVMPFPGQVGAAPATK